MTGIRLCELLDKVKKSVSETFPGRFWVRAEVRAVGDKNHCYLDLADKDEDGALNAQARGIIWTSTWKILKPYFVKETGRVIEVGMNLLIHAQVQFSEMYGLSLIIDDIDPSYTVGELELVRLRTIERLRKEGMMDMNATLSLPRLPRNFAVISSSGAAGWGDFQKHLLSNEYGFCFNIELFEAPMQGADAPSGIVSAMDCAMGKMNCGNRYDAVLILRGGGSVGDLSCFDDYELCANIAQYPLPVLTAVGHDRDYHICDMVACVSVKTPTALADYILDMFVAEDEMLSSLSIRFWNALHERFVDEMHRLDMLKMQMSAVLGRRFSEERNRLDVMEMDIKRHNPAEVLKAGYSLVRSGGKMISSVNDVNVGSVLEIVLKDGSLIGAVKEKNNY